MIFVLWSIRLALCAMAASLFLQIGKAPPTRQAIARWLWTVGCALYVVHVVCAFHFVHQWSHRRAEQQVAEQTEVVIGWSTGAGIYFNHLFTLVWIVDCVWWWLVDANARTRMSVTWTWAARGYMLIIAINGAIVFESGPVRWIGAVVIALLVGAWVLGKRASRVPK